MKNPSPTGMALMQDGTLNLTFVANALRFYANHIEGHPQRGDYFPADLRLAADMLAADTPPPSTHLRGDGEAAIIECLAAGKPFVFDPATNFLHADDGTVEGGIRYAPAPSQHVAPDEDVVETVARRIYEDAHKGMANIWAWNDRGLGDEHPGTRERYLGYARSAIAATAPPAPSQHVLARWLPIAQADKTINHVTEFTQIGLTLKNSDTFWVRDEDGRVYQAAWSEGNNGRDYWWDWEAESPVDPVEFMPHPLDPRWATTTEGSPT